MKYSLIASTNVMRNRVGPLLIRSTFGTFNLVGNYCRSTIVFITIIRLLLVLLPRNVVDRNISTVFFEFTLTADKWNNYTISFLLQFIILLCTVIASSFPKCQSDLRNRSTDTLTFDSNKL